MQSGHDKADDAKIKKTCDETEYTMEDFLIDYPEAKSYSHHARERAYQDILKK